MSEYLSASYLRDVVQRLQASSLASRACDYFIFKRAATLEHERTGQYEVVTGIGAPLFQGAISEWARLDQPKDPWGYFVPIGTKTKTQGYRKVKWNSNGPSDSVNGNQALLDFPFRRIPNISPMTFRWEPQPADVLRGHFTDAKPGTPARLTDVAAWWLRFTDLETVPGWAPERNTSTLTTYFRAAHSVDNAELRGLFDDVTAAGEFLLPDQLADSPAGSDSYLPPPPAATSAPTRASTPALAAPKELDEGLSALVTSIADAGFTFRPWQIAAFMTAVRTKPFVILAGISGTGKTKLPRLVADATGAHATIVPVRPDWNDSTELLGYTRIDNTFVPGSLLRACAAAAADPDQQHFFVLDEMNLARVEYYLAEVLSRIEDRHLGEGPYTSEPLLPDAPTQDETDWGSVGLPRNLCIVGSVNMDESTFGFSKKVLDRAFVIEFSEVDLEVLPQVASDVPTTVWPRSMWEVANASLAAYPSPDDAIVSRVISTLVAINRPLMQAQLQIGYRVRDEIALFCLAAADYSDQFVAAGGDEIDPLDLALTMKVLPRLQGSAADLEDVLEQLFEWATPDRSDDATAASGTAGFPLVAQRLDVMLQRLRRTGFTSYWL